MRSPALALLALVCAFSLFGCAAQKPLISHAHVGHGLTHWMDTPENQGLFQVARKELDGALREADAALAGELAPAQKLTHFENVVHALNPSAVASGPGLGYGAIRALESAVEHLEYAATSDDASANIVSSVAPITEMGLAILERLKAVESQALAARRGDGAGLRRVALDKTALNGSASAAPSSVGYAPFGTAPNGAGLDRAAVEMRASLRAAAQGHDADGNGRIDATPGEAGLAQLHALLDAMLARESDPKYAPLPKKYLLGVVRLPNGKWIFTSIRKALSRPSYGHTTSN